MKKTTILSTFALSILYLSACTGVEQSLEEPSQETPEVINEEATQVPENDTNLTEETPEVSEIESDQSKRIYNNQEIGFEFNLTENWGPDTAREEATSISFMNTNTPQDGEGREAITYMENTKNLDLDQASEEFIKEMGYDKEERMIRSASYAPFKIGGEQTIKLVPEDPFGMFYYFFLHNNRIFRIDTQGNLFTEEVLKTFKFNL